MVDAELASARFRERIAVARSVGESQQRGESIVPRVLAGLEQDGMEAEIEVERE